MKLSLHVTMVTVMFILLAHCSLRFLTWNLDMTALNVLNDLVVCGVSQIKTMKFKHKISSTLQFSVSSQHYRHLSAARHPVFLLLSRPDDINIKLKSVQKMVLCIQCIIYQPKCYMSCSTSAYFNSIL